MEMQSKYYTPNIEEFHVGFEFYIKDDKNIFTNHFVKEDIFCRTDLLKKYIKENFYQIKYLDQEDIESLGFKLDQKNKDGYSFIYRNMIDGDYMLWTKDFNKLEIFNMMGNKTNEISFEGFIKNKSELKKLLKQLQIE
jgi:hypothetical protein